MPPRIPLPRLTLYTGGKECSLCEVAKEELAVLRRTHPFDLEYWNIRSPPAGADERQEVEEAVPVRYSRTAPRGAARAEAPHPEGRTGEGAGGMEAREDEHDPTRGEIDFVPYRSVLRAFGPSTNAPTSPDKPSEVESAPSFEDVLPPWRRAVGKSFFELTARGAPIPSDRELTAEEAERYSDILLRTFHSCSSVAVGSDIIPVNCVEYEIDPNRTEDGQAERVIAYYRTASAVPFQLVSSADDARPTPADDVICWNCRQKGHRAQSCSLPKDYALLSASRQRQLEVQELAVPDYALAAYHSHVYDEEDKERRLRLAARLRPNKVSDELGAAVFWLEDEEEEDDPREAAIQQAFMRVSRRRRLWPWLERMSIWGYPPGYHTTYDAMDVVYWRIKQSLADDSSAQSDDDLLEVYGGLGSPEADDDSSATRVPLVEEIRPEKPDEQDTSSDIEELPSSPVTLVSRPLSHAVDETVNSGRTASDHSPSPSSAPASSPPSPPASPPSPPPPPPPPTDEPPSPPHVLPSPVRHHTTPAKAARVFRDPPPRRWVEYETDLFSSLLLPVFSSARPLPLGR